MIMLQGTCKITPEYGLYNHLFVLLKSAGCLIQKTALSINRELVNSQLCDGFKEINKHFLYFQFHFRKE